MKNIYKLLAILLFAFTATLNAQLINSDGTKNDEFLGKQKQPVINNGCECVNSDIDNFSFTYSSSFAYALANDRAVIEAAKREAWDWYNHQTDLMKDYIGTKNNKTFNSFNEAKDFLFKKTEYNNLRRNSPLTRDKMSQGYNQTNHASKTGLKALKALDHRESEIRAGNLNSSLYPDFKVNNTFLKDIRTISDLNNIRATTNTTTLDGLSKAPEFRALRDMMNTIISSGNYSQFESKAFIAKNNVYNSYGIWDKLNMMQFVIHHDLHKNYVSFPYNIPTDAFNKFFNRVDIATPDYIEKEIRNEYTDYDVFHDEYWRVILRDKYNNAGAMTGIAKAEHQKLRDKAYNDRKNATPIGASLDVDRIVKQLNIRDKYERLWINANKDKATEFLNRLKEAKKKDEQENANPIPDNTIIGIVGNNYESEIANINNEFAAGARIAKLIEELQITDPSQKDWMYKNIDSISRFESEINLIGKDLFLNLIAHASNPDITEIQRTELINDVINASEPELSSNNIIDYKSEFLRMAGYLKWAGSQQKKIFGQFVEDVSEELINLKYGEVVDLYKVIRQEYLNAKFDYVKAITFTVIKSFEPVVQVSLVALGGGAALRILKALPGVYLTVSAELSPIIARLTAIHLPLVTSTTSVAYKSLMHTSKYGIQSYNELVRVFNSLGISRSAANIQFHHLIEQRFINIPGVKEWLGFSTNNWKCIAVSSVPGSGNEHNILFSQPWIQAIAKGNGVGWTGTNTSTATLEDIKNAARAIYADYPEILQALGLN
ncbi:hypothetical protein [Tenacibaculum sp. 190524A05c]